MMPTTPFDDARRDAAVQAFVTEFHNWRTGDWNAVAYALAAYEDELARQRAEAGQCAIAHSYRAARLRSP